MAPTTAESNTMPVKTRDVLNHHMDSTIWDELKLRQDDIVITTYAKSGTTWMQQIVSQLLHEGDPNIPAGTLSPWVDLRLIPREAMLGMLDAQTGRRFFKTHLPLDALVWDPKLKYIFIGRDGRDMIWSMHNHFFNATPAFYAMFENAPGGIPGPLRPSADPREIFIDLIEDDTRPSLGWPFWSHIRGWWEARHQPNMLLVHFSDLKADLEGQMRRISDFLDIPDMPEEKFQAAVEHSTFNWMKAHAELIAPPQAEMAWTDGAKTFVNKGTNARWVDSLSEEDNARYISKAKEELGDDCANWLQNGGTFK